MLMKIHRFIGSFNLQPGIFLLKDEDITRQINKVLRLKQGEKIILCDGKGNEAQAKIISIQKNQIKLQLNALTLLKPSRVQITLYCAALKRENFDWVVQKSTEVGVTTIIPILTERTVKQNLNLARLEKIAKEAAEQSGRSFVTEVRSPLALSEAFNQAKNNQLNLIFELGALPLSNQKVDHQTIGIFIGPEGGWTETEIQTAQKSGIQIAGLGKLTLRAETAAIVASYLACNILAI